MRILLLMLVALSPLLAQGRAVHSYYLRNLIDKSQLVFVGRVKSVEPSGIKTTLTYPTWHGVTFEWLNCSIEVIDPIKGVRKGELVLTVMLSAPEGEPSFNPPGMVEPKAGKAYLLCLAPTTLSNVFAALTAPWDDDQAIFVLDRSFWAYSAYREGKESSDEHNDRYAILWSLIDGDGKLLPAGAEKMRKTYTEEITITPTSNTVIHLQWKTFTSKNGWQWDVPKGSSNLTNWTESRNNGGLWCLWLLFFAMSLGLCVLLTLKTWGPVRR